MAPKPETKTALAAVVGANQHHAEINSITAVTKQPIARTNVCSEYKKPSWAMPRRGTATGWIPVVPIVDQTVKGRPERTFSFAKSRCIASLEKHTCGTIELVGRREMERIGISRDNVERRPDRDCIRQRFGTDAGAKHCLCVLRCQFHGPQRRRARMIFVVVSSGERCLSGSTIGGYLDDNVGREETASASGRNAEIGGDDAGR
jgi:hypothetical protein